MVAACDAMLRWASRASSAPAGSSTVRAPEGHRGGWHSGDLAERRTRDVDGRGHIISEAAADHRSARLRPPAVSYIGQGDLPDEHQHANDRADVLPVRPPWV